MAPSKSAAATTSTLFKISERLYPTISLRAEVRDEDLVNLSKCFVLIGRVNSRCCRADKGGIWRVLG